MSDLNKKEAGIQEITQMLFNVNFAGTNSKEEFTELQNNMIKMLSQHQYSYSDIENYFIGWGYQVPMIKEIYKHLTGLDPERVNSTDYLLNMPGCIPGFNYGWGEGKGSKYKYVFIIGYKLGFGVFGQIDDLSRELIQYTLDLEEALNVLNKNAKDIKTCKSIISVPEKDINKSLEVPYLCTDAPITQKVLFKGRTASLAKSIDSYQMQPHEVRAMLRVAYDQNEITAQEHKDLYDYYLKRYAEEDEASDITKELEKEDIKTNQTTQDMQKEVVNETKTEFGLDKIAYYIKGVNKYFEDNLSELLAKALIEPKEVKYVNKDLDNSIEKTPEVPGQNPVQYFNKAAKLSVVLAVTLNEKANLGQQFVLTMFAIDDKGNVETDGNFKGVDEEIYPLNASGLENYFSKLEELDKPGNVKDDVKEEE